MLILAIVAVIILIWIYRKKKSVNTESSNKVLQKKQDYSPEWTNSKALQLRSDLQGRNSEVVDNGPDYDESTLSTFLQEPHALDQPDGAANAGRINYGPAVNFQSPTGGLSSGEIEKQLPLKKSSCQLIKEQQEIRNIDLRRKLFYGDSNGLNPKSCKCHFDDRSFARFAWETPSSISNYYKTFPEDSAFDPIIPFHL
jgi:hypothetical protein